MARQVSVWRRGFKPVLLAILILPFLFIGKAQTAGPAVTVTEFSDFQCPYCQRAAVVVEQLRQIYGDNVKFVFKQMPLPMHQYAFKAAEASVIAQQQGKFWEYHDRLFAASDLSVNALKQIATEVGINQDQFSQALDTDASRAAVDKDIQEAKQLGVRGTPTFFVNGKIVRSAATLARLQGAIDVARTRPVDETQEPRQTHAASDSSSCEDSSSAARGSLIKVAFAQETQAASTRTTAGGITLSPALLNFGYQLVGTAANLQVNSTRQIWPQPVDLAGGAGFAVTKCDPAFQGGICVVAHDTTIEGFFTEDFQGPDGFHSAGQRAFAWVAPADVAGISAPYQDALGRELLFATVADGNLYEINLTEFVADPFFIPITSVRIPGRQAGCVYDTLAAPSVQEWNKSDSAFRSSQSANNATQNDLVFVITRDGCGDTTHNRVFAFESNVIFPLALPKWVFNFDGSIRVEGGLSACTVDDARNMLYCATMQWDPNHNSLFALDTLTGALRWAGNFGYLNSSPQIGYAGQHLYVVNGLGLFYALNIDPNRVCTAFGQGGADECWRLQLNAGPSLSEIAISTRPDDPHWLAVSAMQPGPYGGIFQLIDAGTSGACDPRRFSNGTCSPFSLPTENGAFPTTSPRYLRASGFLYVGASDGKVYELHPINLDFEAPEFVVVNSNPNIRSRALDAVLDSSMASFTQDRLMATSQALDIDTDPGVVNRFSLPWGFSRFSTDIAIGLNGPTQVRVGRSYVVTLAITNNGPDWATDVVISNPPYYQDPPTLSQGSFVHFPGKGIFAFLGDMAPHTTATMSVPVPASSIPVSRSLSPSVKANEPDPDNSNNIASLTTEIRRRLVRGRHHLPGDRHRAHLRQLLLLEREPLRRLPAG